jgi:hypothetical protein
MDASKCLVRFLALVSTLLLSGMNAQGRAAEILVGAGLGYSFSLEGNPHVITLAPVPSHELGIGSISSIGIVLKDHLAVFTEVCLQRYDGSRTFVYWGGAVEFRLFEDTRKPWNPFAGIGAFGLLSSGNSGTGGDYPGAISGEFHAGVRIRLMKALYFRPRVSFLLAPSSLMLQAGIDFAI